jgi:flotillin
MKSKYENDTEVAKSQRDYEIRQAGYDLEVQTKSAQSKLAYDLQAAITKQKIKEEAMQISVVERAQQIKVQEQVLKISGVKLHFHSGKFPAERKFCKM